MVTNLTQEQLASVQIDESVIFLNYGLEDERFLAPTRGGGEFSATATVRDIEFDGRRGKTAGAQAIEEQAASLKVTTLNLSQETLALAIPNCTISDENGKVIKNPKSGLIPMESYLKNVTSFSKTLGGKYKKITIHNPMHENGINTKAVQKSEGELALEFLAHYPISNLDGDLWSIEEIDTPPVIPKDPEPVALTANGKTATKITKGE